MKSQIWTRLALPGDLAKAVSATKGYKAALGHLAMYPYNVHRPEQSIWWAFPRGKSVQQAWPAYHAGKFMFYKPFAKAAVSIGLHIEKGIGLDLAKAYGGAKARNMVMDDRWAWHSVLADLASGKWEPALEQIRERGGTAPEIGVEVGAPLDQPALRTKYSTYVFESPGSDRLNLVVHDSGNQPIPEIEEVRSLGSLSKCLAPLSQKSGEMLWINLTLGLTIEVSSGGSGLEWGASEMWRNVMEPLAPWVR